MSLIRMRAALFDNGREPSIGPLTFDVAPGERISHTFTDNRSAEIAALLSAGMVKATSGSVTIGEYDPRVQPVHCKRLVGYVPHDPVELGSMRFERYIDYRAGLWEIDPAHAQARASSLLGQLDGVHAAFAYPLIGALLAEPQVLILDRPQLVYAKTFLDAAGSCAVFSTHVDPAVAQAYK